MQSVGDQVQAVRRGAGWFHPFPRGTLAVRGKDRAAFLHRVLSHDIKGLPIGQARPACLLDRQGKILFATLVHARPDELLLEMERSDLSRARAALERYALSDAVGFTDQSPAVRPLHLHGPALPALFPSLFQALTWPSHSLEWATAPAPSGLAGAYRWDLLGMPGAVLWIQPDREPEILSRLRDAPAVACSTETFHTLRIEAGVPWPGREIRDTVILNELGSDDWMSFTKGCYIGQEIVARIKHRAHPPRLLTGFVLDAKTQEESSLYQGEEAVGILTSVCESPTLGKIIALGFLKHGIPAVPLHVGSPASPGTATPTPLPFVS